MPRRKRRFQATHNLRNTNFSLKHTLPLLHHLYPNHRSTHYHHELHINSNSPSPWHKHKRHSHRFHRIPHRYINILTDHRFPHQCNSSNHNRTRGCKDTLLIHLHFPLCLHLHHSINAIIIIIIMCHPTPCNDHHHHHLSHRSLNDIFQVDNHSHLTNVNPQHP